MPRQPDIRFNTVLRGYLDFTLPGLAPSLLGAGMYLLRTGRTARAGATCQVMRGLRKYVWRNAEVSRATEERETLDYCVVLTDVPAVGDGPTGWRLIMRVLCS